MIRPIFRFSRIGLIGAGLFLTMAVAVFCWILYAAATNPADSGESGILLLPFAMPWIQWLPAGILGLWSAIGCILFNACLIYLAFGGLRFTAGEQKD